ncbi:hypothetical protein GX411_04300 [Candidatus Fermentibacteria bacterium]|nr:hypothetical protein [Candidatus Fermentibacteria bacterium]
MMGIALALSLICSASVDTLYKVEFNSILNDWIPGPQWAWQEDCMNVHLFCHSGGYFTVADRDRLLSPVITLPSDIDSVVVVFDHWYYTHGWINGMSWAETNMSLEMTVPGVSQSVDLWSLDYLIEYPVDYLESDSGLVSITLNQVWPGEPVIFEFYGEVSAYSSYTSATSELSWDIRAFYILNYTEDRGLEPSTWGAIKSLF